MAGIKTIASNVLTVREYGWSLRDLIGFLIPIQLHAAMCGDSYYVCMDSPELHYQFEFGVNITRKGKNLLKLLAKSERGEVETWKHSDILRHTTAPNVND
jgi:hypothetical protein